MQPPRHAPLRCRCLYAPDNPTNTLCAPVSACVYSPLRRRATPSRVSVPSNNTQPSPVVTAACARAQVACSILRATRSFANTDRSSVRGEDPQCRRTFCRNPPSFLFPKPADQPAPPSASALVLQIDPLVLPASTRTPPDPPRVARGMAARAVDPRDCWPHLSSSVAGRARGDRSFFCALWRPVSRGPTCQSLWLELSE